VNLKQKIMNHFHLQGQRASQAIKQQALAGDDGGGTFL
jgi:hypothetical protein